MKKDLKIILSLLLLAFVPTIAGTVRFLQLTSGEVATPEDQRFFDDPIPVFIHIFAVFFYSVLGAFQFAPNFRKNHLKWHKMSGRALVVLGFLSATTGLWLTLIFPKLPTDGEWLYSIRLVVGTWMTLCIGIGLFHILKRNIQSHSHWMIRGYAIGMGAGTQVFTHLPWFIFVGGDPTGIPRDLMMGAGWLINAVVAEWIIRKS
ncbi:MAG: DUF2306 domain-containing protein [Leptospira sp.]|nr:DUF2306 domain-containing protein [Leptospira sp.]